MLRACRAMAMSAEPPNTMLMPTNSPMAQAAVPGSPRTMTQANINAARIDPGKPWQNGSNVSFNGKFRDECLSMEWFKNRIDARIVIEQFRRQYNEARATDSGRVQTATEFNNQPRNGHFLSPQWTEECQQVNGVQAPEHRDDAEPVPSARHSQEGHRTDAPAVEWQCVTAIPGQSDAISWGSWDFA